ncbi:glyoxalase family protein [Apiospora phragmitis]|uniref:Glyoxalase family protein n=1 Tax=Apiospora phragmitis TaxID=2905665 RepID=A0ABR1TS99_9PEZI
MAVEPASSSSSKPLITGIAHINLSIPPGTLAHAKSFYGETLGLVPRAVPAAQTETLAWFDVGTATGQQVHVSTAKHAEDTTSATSSRHPCFAVGSLEALQALQTRIGAHLQRGGPDAPMMADPVDELGEPGRRVPDEVLRAGLRGQPVGVLFVM